jgi:SNF2 family DNA or RNA helicase
MANTQLEEQLKDFKGAFVQSLVRNNKQIKEDRAIVIVETAQMQFKREIEDMEIPKEFSGILRPYQKAGYNWFHFLRKYNFGGCLADDMGLGKTVQTLALLQKIKEENHESGLHTTSLLIMPTSLVYNWLNENANQYGFHQVYTNKKITNRTGYEEEKWHWSYLPKAKKYLDFYNKNLTNTEIKDFLGSDQAQQVDMLKNYVNGVSTN